MKPVILTADHLNTCRAVPCGNTVVDERLAVPVRVPLIDVDGAPLGVDHRGDAVHRAIPVVQVVFAVRVDFNQAWRDDQTTGVDRPGTLQRTIAYRLDPITDDPDMCDPIETAFRIHDVTICD